VPSILHVDLFNDQFNKSNNDDPNQNTEQAFPYPCVFVEFPGDNPRSSSGGGAKRLSVTPRIYIGIEDYTLDALQIFDLILLVQEALEGWKPSTATSLMYMGQRQDVNHSNVFVWQFDFACEYQDEVVYFKRNTITKPAPHVLELNKTLDIDNDIIRTGDGA
jgi:hypothetical protein